jgi:hypothetical protein
MGTRTFVESVITRTRNTDAMARGARAGGWQDRPRSFSARGRMPVAGCSQSPTFVAGQYDDETQTEAEATFRYYCQEHALATQQLVDEAK